MNRQTLIIMCLMAVGAAGVWAIMGSAPAPDGGHDHEHESEGEHAEEEMERGPHGGRLLRDGAFSVELQIFEAEGPPEFRLFAYSDGQPLDASTVDATVELTRLGGDLDRFAFVPRGDYLQGQGVVDEPHSFDVRVAVRSQSGVHNWAYPSYEARVRISADIAESAGIRISQAGPALIRESLLLYGSIIPDERRVRSVGARFPGVVREVRRNLGDRVTADETLALVESNESLQTYPVRSPIGGVVLSRAVNPGENVGEQPLFTVADLSIVHAELAVFRRDLPRVRAGQSVRVQADDGSVEGTGAISFISPVGSGESQSIRLRVTLDNRDGRWQPGMFVTGDVETASREVPVAVSRSALQKYRDFDVVFANVGDLFEPRMLDLGSMDRDHAEAKGGIAPGDSYVVANSFLIKAEIGKAGAGHDH